MMSASEERGQARTSPPPRVSGLGPEPSVAYASTAGPIARIAAPTREIFEREYVGASRPVVITGIVDRWPAFTRWSHAYFLERFADAAVTMGRLRDGKTATDPNEGVSFETMTMRRGLEIVFSNECPSHYFVTQLKGPLLGVFDDVTQPKYYRPGPFSRSRLWIGGPGTVTHLHRDFPENLFAQVRGRKRFFLIPPDESSLVYPHPLLSRLPQASAVDAANPDYRRFPRFREAHPVTVDVGPGDMLFIPSRWWHQVHTLDMSLCINWWWQWGLWNAVRDVAELIQMRLRGVRY